MFSTVDASGATRVRTEDPLLAKQMRYQLRHSPNGGTRENAPHVGPGGLEPPTSSLSGMRSNHLSYGPNQLRCDATNEKNTTLVKEVKSKDIRRVGEGDADEWVSVELQTMSTMPFRSMPRANSLRYGTSANRSVVSREVLHVDGLQINVLRKRNRNMYLRVKPPYGAIEVTAPARMPQKAIMEFVRERRDWIDEALHKMAEARSRTFSSVNVDPNVPGSQVTAGRGARESANVDDGSASGFTWNEEYVARARESIERQLPDLLRKWEPVIGCAPTKITLRTMTSRWGSCTPKTGRIRLNLQLGLMEPKFLEYVLVHEMTHLWESGHGKGFQARMSMALPNWKDLRRELNRCTIFEVPQVQQ